MNTRRPHFRGRRPVTATPPPWTQPVAPPTPQLDGDQAQLALRSRARVTAETIVRASIEGWYSTAQSDLVHYVARALEHPDGEIHVQPPPITGRSDNLKSEKEAYARVAKLAAELEALRVPAEWPRVSRASTSGTAIAVFVIMGRVVGPAGYGVSGLLDLTLRLSPRVRALFATKGET